MSGGGHCSGFMAIVIARNKFCYSWVVTLCLMLVLGVVAMEVIRLGQEVTMIKEALLAFAGMQ